MLIVGAIAEFLTKALKHPEIRLTDLNSYLIKPVQRICKYPLLLRELSKAFEGMGIVNDEAKNDLSIAMGGMSEVLKKANDYMSTLRSENAAPPSADAAVPAPAVAAAAPVAAAVVDDGLVGNICNFCKKPVSVAERRMEDGVVYHAELCYNREKAASSLAKKESKKKGKTKSRSGREDGGTVVNFAADQRSKLALKKARKEQERKEKEEQLERDRADKAAREKEKREREVFEIFFLWLQFWVSSLLLAGGGGQGASAPGGRAGARASEAGKAEAGCGSCHCGR